MVYDSLRLTATGLTAFALLVLATTGCQMPHVPQGGDSRTASPSVPADTGENPSEPDPVGTPESPAPVGAMPELSIADASAGEGDGTLAFTVSLSQAGADAVTVSYATENGTATAGSDYEEASGMLRFPAHTTESRTITVTVSDDKLDEPVEQLTVTLSNPVNAVLAGGGDYATATGVIEDDDPQPPVAISDDDDPPPLELSSLQVTAAGAMYPAFDGGVHHYAVTCTDFSTVRVRAQAVRAGAHVTLLRNDPADNERSTGTLDAEVTVDDDHDIAIELSDTDDTVTYVVHCLPEDFPDITVLKKTEDVTDGLLLVTPAVYNSRYRHSHRFLAIIDNNGVPRFHQAGGVNFRRHANGPLIDGRRVRYSHSTGSAVLLDGNFDVIRSVRPVSPVNSFNGHDFLITDDDTFLFLAYEGTTRDLSDLDDPDGSPYPANSTMEDSVIREVDLDGEELFRWNSWDHMKLDPDCRVFAFPGEYAHLNSLQLIDGDIVASFKGCAQVLRIDRSSGTGAIVWKLGGTTPTRSEDTEYLEIVNDDEGEFCGQHHATLTDASTVVLFDNGDGCLGPRKEQSQFTRVVEYDISSGTQASHFREHRLPVGQGFADFAGSVTVLDNGHWVISWGRTDSHTVSVEELISISEVDPATGTSVFEMNMSKSPYFVQSYRVYREREADMPIPLYLP